MSIAGLDFIAPGLSSIIEVTSEIIKRSREGEQQARAEKDSFLQKLENAKGEDVFKYMNLISFASMDEFVAAARLHAQQSFKICLFSAVTGFLIILISIGFGIYFQIAGTSGMSAAYLGAAVGLVSEAISAIFFSLYAKTISQVNRFHDRLLGSQSAYAAMLSTSLITDDAERQKHIISLSTKMMSRLESLDKGLVHKS